MKRILVAALAAFASLAFGATTVPPALINPSGSSVGQAIVSTGASTAPAWGAVPLTAISGTLPIANGGTNATTASAALANLGGVTATQAAGRLLNIQVFTSSGTYTPTSGATKAIVEVMAPGGGSGGNPATSTGQTAMSGPGNAGAYGKIWIASGLTTTTVTIGAAGTAGTTAPTAGGTGGTTSFGSLISCLGGAGGPAGSAVTNATSFIVYPSATAATCSGSGTFLVSGSGASAEKGFLTTGQTQFPGSGASTMWGQGGQGRTTTPNSGTGYGAGAGSFFLNASSAATAGAPGAPAIVIVQEFN